MQLLLVHGEADNNTGTFPIQSERYYNALKGFGATTRLVFLPYESHGYAARERPHLIVWNDSVHRCAEEGVRRQPIRKDNP